MSSWLSSFAAIQVLRNAGVAEPVSTLTHLAEARQVRARASWARFGEDRDVVFPQEPKCCEQSDEVLASWPDIPADFWRWINAGTSGTSVHVEAGVFATTVVYNPDIGDYSDTEFIKLFGVTFNSEDLAAVLGGVSTRHDTPPLPSPKPSNAGRKADLDRWAEFGAALALVANTADRDAFASPNALYNATADALAFAERAPLDMKRVRLMVQMASLWIDAGAISPPAKEA